MNDKNTPVRFKSSINLTGIPEPSPVSVHSVVCSDDGELLFLTDEFNHRVVCVNRNGKFISSFGGKGSGEGQFHYPRALAVVNNNNQPELMVCDAWNHRIQRFDLAGAYLGSFGGIGGDLDQFNEPVSLVTDLENGIWILDRCNHRIKNVTADGQVLGTIGSARRSIEELKSNDPVDIYFDKNLEKYDFGFQYPESFTFLEDGSFLVADTGNRRLCKVTRSGKLAGVIKLDIRNNPPFIYPLHVCHLINNFVFLGSFGQASVIIDVDRPWIKIPVDVLFKENSDSTKIAFCLISRFDDEVDFALVCGGEIRNYSFNPDLVNVHNFSIPLPDQDEIDTFPGQYSEYYEEGLHSFFLDMQPSENINRHIQTFIEVEQKYIHSLDNKLINLEKELCGIITEQVFREEIVYQFVAETKDLQVAQLQLNETRLRCSALLEYHDQLRHALVYAVAKTCNLITDKRYEQQVKHERETIINTVTDLYTHRLSDYKKIWEQLPENLEKSKDDSFYTLALASVLLLLLKEHRDYLVEALKSLGLSDAVDRWDIDDLLPKMPVDELATNYTEQIVITAASLCVTLGRYEMAIDIFRHFLSRGDLRDCTRAMALFWCEYSQRIPDWPPIPDDDLPLLAGAMRSHPEELDLVERFQKFRTKEIAQKLIDRFKESWLKDETEIENVRESMRRQKILENLESKTTILSVNEAVPEQLLAATKPGLKAGVIRYLESIHLTHPITGKALAPAKVLVLNKTELLISEVRIPGKTYSELFVYENGKGTRILTKIEGVQVKCLEKYGSGQALLIVGDQDSSAGLSGIKTINTQTGEIADLFMDIKKLLPEVPNRIIKTSEGDFIVACNPSPESISSAQPVLWVVDSGFTRSAPLSNYCSGLVGDLCERNGLVAATIWDQSSVLLFDREKGVESWIEGEMMYKPHAIDFDKHDRLYIGCVGFGLQAYDVDRRLCYQVHRVENENSFFLGQCYCHRIGDNFNGGNLISSDINGLIHVFRIE